MVVVLLFSLVTVLLISLVADFAGYSFTDAAAGCCFVVFVVCCSIDFAGSYIADFPMFGLCIAILLKLDMGQAHYKLCSVVAHTHQQNSNAWSKACETMCYVAGMYGWAAHGIQHAPLRR